MAQILIRKRKHFAEDAKPEAWSDFKWRGRPQRGDVVEVRPDGYWRIESLGTGDKGWDRDAFALIEVPGVPVEDVAHLHGSHIKGTKDDPDGALYKARYRFDKWDQLPWVTQTVEVNGVVAEEWYVQTPALTGHASAKDKVN